MFGRQTIFPGWLLARVFPGREWVALFGVALRSWRTTLWPCDFATF
jgi:hypothetical protein